MESLKSKERDRRIKGERTETYMHRTTPSFHKKHSSKNEQQNTDFETGCSKSGEPKVGNSRGPFVGRV